jgi:hypothetical protein
VKRTKTNGKQFVVCIDNFAYSASLELHKIYQVLPDERACKSLGTTVPLLLILGKEGPEVGFGLTASQVV